MYLIAGLGNPDKEYEDTRHNLGFKVIDEILSSRFSLSALKRKKKCDAYIAEVSLAGRKLIFAQPQTYMNNSGVPVSSLLSWYKIPPEHLIVVYDDVDLEVGQLRIRLGGGFGGHHGVESVIQHAGTPDFIRVKIGIGRDSMFKDVSDYVLSKIPPEEKELLNQAITSAAAAVMEIVASGVDSAMNKFNK